MSTQPRATSSAPTSLWEGPTAALLERLRTTVEGLSGGAAAERLRRDGPNVVGVGHRRAVVVDVALKFQNPLILLLLAAATIAGLSGDRRSFVVIVVIVLMSIVLDFFQEHRAGRAAERLRLAARLHTQLLRDGLPRDVPTTDVVSGDVVLLSAGDLVPADAWLLEARDLFVNQALLTGEPYPVEKRADDATAGGPAGALADDPRAVLMGSSIVSGTGRAVIVATGARSVLGQIGVSLQRQPPPSSFDLGTRAFGMLIVRLALFMVLFVLLVNAWRGRPWLESFLFAMALAVGLTPELLPMVVSVTLSRGALRMSRRKVLVKRLAAIHDLGSMDVLCTDKTGTLTEARIRLAHHGDASGDQNPRVLLLARLNSHFQTGLESPLDEAILQTTPAPDQTPVAAWKKLDELPFDFERRRVSVLVRHADQNPLMITKGAFEDIVRLSSRFEDQDGATRPLDDDRRAALLRRIDDLGRDGFRVLAIAFAERPASRLSVTNADEVDLTFAGFVAFHDPPKESARLALRSLGELGVRVKVVTGDNEFVAEHVCRQLDLPVDDILTGAELQQMDDHALETRVQQATLFCRVTPAQKSRIILALKRRRSVVGFLGDGINDAPALHAADVGISVDGGVDVAKEAADLILMERDLLVLRDAVLEGRRTLGNIIKYILMGTSSNFGNTFSMAGAALFLPFLPMLPIQILVNNFLYDLSEVPIPTDRVDDDYVRRPHRWDMAFIQRFMLTIGPVSSVFDFLTFFVLYKVMGAGEALFQTGWFMESLTTQALVIFVIRTRGNPLRSRPALPLAITSAAVVAAAVWLPFTPLGRTLGFVRPPAALLAVIAVTVLLYLVAAQLAKRWFYRRSGIE